MRFSCEKAVLEGAVAVASRAVARKSIVAKCRIKKGERFSEENLTVKRPGTGISPMRWPELMGQTADRDYAEDELIGKDIL